jgi:hypothetical protein
MGREENLRQSHRDLRENFFDGITGWDRISGRGRERGKGEEFYHRGTETTEVGRREEFFDGIYMILGMGGEEYLPLRHRGHRELGEEYF